jgi:flagellar biosynthesis protein FlhF
MRIKKFTASTLQEATELMRKEFGDNAIIMGTRRIGGNGKLPFFGKGSYEITGAVDATTDSKSAAQSPLKIGYQVHAPAQSRTAVQESPVQNLQKVADIFEQRKQAPAPAHPSLEVGVELRSLKGELWDLKSTLKEITDRMRYDRLPRMPETLKESYGRLVENGVDEQLSVVIVQQMMELLSDDEASDPAAVDQALLAICADLVPAGIAPSAPSAGNRIVALIGPTGVGKTTTIAKLAATAKLVHRQDVAIISVDTYRLGAIQQMQMFAEIAKIPLEIVYQPEDLLPALKKFQGKQVVYLDTIGRSQKNERELAELKAFCDIARPTETHCVVSASTNERTAADIISRFGVLGPDYLIFTKLDEAGSYGSILNIVQKQKLPVSYLTNGQVVPDDLRVADSATIAGLVCRGLEHA